MWEGQRRASLESGSTARRDVPFLPWPTLGVNETGALPVVDGHAACLFLPRDADGRSKRGQEGQRRVDLTSESTGRRAAARLVSFSASYTHALFKTTDSMPSAVSNGNDALSRLVSPVPGEKETSNQELPGYYTCWYTGLPPERGVYLNIPGADGQYSPQVFEHNAVYRVISTTGSFAQFRMLRHPVLGSKDEITGVLHGFVDRRRALECVVDVPPEV